MKLIINFLFSTRLKKILIIFGVGLISRVLVNYGLEINVFKDYINYISLFYYGFMACFVVYINELSYISLFKINLKVFYPSVFRNIIKTIFYNHTSGNKLH